MARKAPQAVVVLTAEGVATKLKGAYSASAKYTVGQWVISGEAIWACNETVEKVAPAEGVPSWTLIGSIE